MEISVLSRIIRPYRATPLQGPLRGALALLACVSLLQTPVPMVHDHAIFASEAGLASHLDRHHAQEPECEFAEQCHWHFVLPCDIGHDHDDGDDHDVPAEEPAICGGSTGFVTGTGERATETIHIGRLLGMPSAARQFVAARDGSVHSRPALMHSPTERLCAVLCVVRC